MPDSYTIELHVSSCGRFYGFTPWYSLFHTRVNNISTPVQNKILSFKRTGKHEEYISNCIQFAKDYFKIPDVAVIPSSKRRRSFLQCLFKDDVFERVADTPSRKEVKYEDVFFQVHSVKVKRREFPSVILLDDVITSGWSMTHFSRLLTSPRIIKIGLGLHQRFNPKLVASREIKQTSAMNMDFDVNSMFGGAELSMEVDLSGMFDFDSLKMDSGLPNVSSTVAGEIVKHK